jgi:hypothetical protein
MGKEKPTSGGISALGSVGKEKTVGGTKKILKDVTGQLHNRHPTTR